MSANKAGGGSKGKLVADTYYFSHFNGYVEKWCNVKLNDGRPGEPNVEIEFVQLMSHLNRTLRPSSRAPSRRRSTVCTPSVSSQTRRSTPGAAELVVRSREQSIDDLKRRIRGLFD
jgi:hypothetical protein